MLFPTRQRFLRLGVIEWCGKYILEVLSADSGALS